MLRIKLSNYRKRFVYKKSWVTDTKISWFTWLDYEKQIIKKYTSFLKFLTCYECDGLKK